MSLASFSKAAVLSSHKEDDGILHQAFRHPTFLNQIVHCLILGNYQNGGPHALEALLYYVCVENVRRPDTESGIWVLTGIIIRLALRMGYHRDPSQLRGITPFQAELRRRMWAVLYYGETMFSIQTGVPRVIDDAQCDTQPPANLLDSDFDESTVVLPPSRPASELTPVQLTIVRFKLAKLLSSIVARGSALKHEPAQVQAFEDALQKTYHELPTPLKMGNGRICFTDTPNHILCRLAVGVLFEKCRVLLYRRWLDHLHPQRNGAHTDLVPEIKSLIAAALKVLEIQVIIDRETQLKGILRVARWKFSSVIFYEFHMSAAVLTAVIYRTLGNSPCLTLPAATQSDIIVALKKSHSIWDTTSSQSKEAMKSTKMLDSLFAKIESSTLPSPTTWEWEPSLDFADDSFFNMDAGFDFHF